MAVDGLLDLSGEGRIAVLKARQRLLELPGDALLIARKEESAEQLLGPRGAVCAGRSGGDVVATTHSDKRGRLPDSVWVYQAYRTLRPGDVLRWDPRVRQYSTHDGRAPVPCWAIRNGWGQAFGEPPAGQFEMTLPGADLRRKPMDRLTDQDPFPFGKHKGTAMEKVPATYLDWLVDQPWLDRKWPAVADYIQRNRALIDEELLESGALR